MDRPCLNRCNPGCRGRNDTLSALVRRLQAMGAARIAVGDRSGMGDTRGVMERKGIFRLAEELGFEALVFDSVEQADQSVAHL